MATLSSSRQSGLLLTLDAAAELYGLDPVVRERVARRVHGKALRLIPALVPGYAIGDLEEAIRLERAATACAACGAALRPGTTRCDLCLAGPDYE
jgi:hypothetical protein